MPYDRPAGPDDGFVRPMGVTIAEREAAILAERRAQDARIIAELNRIDYKPVVNPETCPHDEVSVFQNMQGDADHETIWGACCACGQWVVSTLWLNSDREVETRPMTPSELDQFAKLEDHRRREEWRWDS